jgi:oligosaccharyltransferase complex subunit beta
LGFRNPAARKKMVGLLMLIALLLFSLMISLAFSPESPTDQQLLVLLNNLVIKASHSLFFKSLIDWGYQLDFKLAHDPNLALQRYEEYLYDGLILFAPSIDNKYSHS